MATYGDPFTTVLPPVGSAGPQYATDIDSILTDIMARLAAKVPLSSVLVTADLNLGGFSAVNANSVQFANQTTVPGATPSARLGVANGNLYYTGLSGAIQLTTGGSLNAAGIGGITGDYGGVNPAQERFDVANTRYDFFTNPTTNTWAYLRGLGFDFAGSATGTARARVTWTGTVNQSYALPPTAPGATTSSLMQMDTTGAMAVSNVLPASANITLSGTGRVIRGNRFTTVPIMPQMSSAAVGTTSTAGGFPGSSQAVSSDIYYQINLPDAENTSLSLISQIVINGVFPGATTVCTLYIAQGVTFTVVAGASATASGTSATLVPTTAFACTAGQVCWVRCQTSAANVANLASAVYSTTVV